MLSHEKKETKKSHATVPLKRRFSFIGPFLSHLASKFPNRAKRAIYKKKFADISKYAKFYAEFKILKKCQKGSHKKVVNKIIRKKWVVRLL